MICDTFSQLLFVSLTKRSKRVITKQSNYAACLGGSVSSLGITTKPRLEGAHAALKRWIGDPSEGLLKLTWAIKDQLNEIFTICNSTHFNKNTSEPEKSIQFQGWHRNFACQWELPAGTWLRNE